MHNLVVEKNAGWGEGWWRGQTAPSTESVHEGENSVELGGPTVASTLGSPLGRLP